MFRKAISDVLGTDDASAVKLQWQYYPEDYQHAIACQNDIGWQHLLRGKLSREWVRVQEESWRKYGVSPKPHQRKWYNTLLKNMWTLIHEMWIERCSDRHGNTPTSKTAAETSQMHRTIRSLYEMKQQCMEEDRHIFYDDVEDHLALPLYTLRKWVNSSQALIMHSVRQAKRLARPLEQNVVAAPPRRPNRKMRKRRVSTDSHKDKQLSQPAQSKRRRTSSQPLADVTNATQRRSQRKRRPKRRRPTVPLESDINIDELTIRQHNKKTKISTIQEQPFDRYPDHPG